MVLDHVADRAGRVVKAAAALDAEVLGHRDLHALDHRAIPERFEDRIREAHEQHVVDGTLAEVVIDAEDVLLDERAEQDPIQIARASRGPGRTASRRPRARPSRIPIARAARRPARTAAAESPGNAPGVRASPSSRAHAPRRSPDPCSRRQRSAAAPTAGRTPRDRARRASRRCPARGRAAGRDSSPPSPRRSPARRAVRAWPAPAAPGKIFL